MRYFIHSGIAIVFILITFSGQGQDRTSAEVNFGCGARLTAELLYSGKTEAIKKEGKPWFHWKLALTGGVNYHAKVETNTYLTPMLNLDVIFLQGGCGSSDLLQLRQNQPFHRKLTSYFIITGTALVGHKDIAYNNSWTGLHGRPAYYFWNFSNPSLTNPFLNSISIGSSYVFSKGIYQRVANINLTIQNLQVHYHNDGGLPRFMKLFGDLKDRFYTGGLIISHYNFNRKNLLQNIELSYQKFTAFGNDDYATGTAIGCTEVPFSEADQLLNRSKLELRFIHASRNYGVGGVLYDLYPADFQHVIHYLGYYAHHISPYPTQGGISVFGQINQPEFP